MKHLYILCIVLFILTSCQKSLTKDEFESWIKIPGNGLRVVKKMNGVEFDVQFRPSQLTSLENIDSDADTFNIKQFTLKIGFPNGEDILKYGVSNQVELQQNLYYYSFLFQDDIYLEKNGKRFPCGLSHFEKSVDSKNYRIFHLVFDTYGDILEGNFDLVVDSDRLGSLPVHFPIDLNDIPQVAGL